MNKQPSMIDAGKLLKWMEESGQANGFWGGTMDDSRRAFDNLTDAIALGNLNSDLIPLPTIKQGDRVFYKKLNATGEVKKLINNPKRAVVYWIEIAFTDYVNCVNIEDLEVIPNE